jgi:hypothetical protein
MTRRQFLIKQRKEKKKVEKSFKKFQKNIENKKYLKRKIKRHLVHHKEMAQINIMKRMIEDLK